jgi:hypothetical protein
MNPVMADRRDEPLIEAEAQKPEVESVTTFNAEHRRVGPPPLDNSLGFRAVL